MHRGGGWQDARLAAESRCQALEGEAGKQEKVRQQEQEQLQGAREKVMLRCEPAALPSLQEDPSGAHLFSRLPGCREAQLRAFHASASEIAELQLKQQARMAGLIRTLEDENEPAADISGRSAPVEASTATRPLDVRATEEEVSSRAECLAGAATQVVMETQLLPGPTLPSGLESLPEGQEEGMSGGGQGEVTMSEQEEGEESEGRSWVAPLLRESGEVVASEEGGGWAADTGVRSQENGAQPLTAPSDSVQPTDGLNIAALLSAVHQEFGGSRREGSSSSDEEESEE